jgi:hypothetical protein
MLLLAGRTQDQRPNVRFPASARCNQHPGSPGSIARRIMTSNWTSLFVAGSLYLWPPRLRRGNTPFWDKEMFLATPGSTIATKCAHEFSSGLVAGSSPPGPTILILCSFDFNGLTPESTNRLLRFVSRCSRSILNELLHCRLTESFTIRCPRIAFHLG